MASSEFSEWADAPDDLVEARIQADLARPPLAAEEEALCNFEVPVLSSVYDLEDMFPIALRETARVGDFGVRYFTVVWLEDALFDYKKNSTSTTTEHYEQFAFWSPLRLRTTVARCAFLQTMGSSGDCLMTLMVKDTLLPLQRLMKGPFVWDQMGSSLGVRVHTRKMEALHRSNGASIPYDDFVYKAGFQMAEWLIECAGCEVDANSTNPDHLFLVRVEGLTQEAPAPAAPAPAAPAVIVTVAPTAPLRVAVPKGPGAMTVLKSGVPIVWKRFSDAECRRSDDRGYFHAIEVKRTHQREAQRIDNDLFAALSRCDDCKITPPPRGTPFLFVVQLLPPRR